MNLLVLFIGHRTSESDGLIVSGSNFSTPVVGYLAKRHFCPTRRVGTLGIVRFNTGSTVTESMFSRFPTLGADGRLLLRQLRDSGGFFAAGRLAGAAALSGVLALGFHSWAGISLTAEGYAKLGVSWTTMMLVSQVTGAALEQWASREAAVGYRVSPGLATGVASAMFTVALVVVWVMLGDSTWAMVAACGAGFLGVLHWMKGTLQGAGRDKKAAGLMLVESTTRLLIVPVLGFGWAIPTGLAAGCLLGMKRLGNGLKRCRSRRGAARFVVGASSASAAAQLLMGGAPLFAWAAGAPDTQVVAVFLLFFLSRAPMTLMLAAQGAVLAGLARGDGHTGVVLNTATRWAPIAITAGFAGIGGWVALPWAIGFIANVVVPPAPSGLVASGMVLCVAVQLVGQRPAAAGQPLKIANAWVWGFLTAAAVGAATVPVWGIVNAASVGFFAGTTISTVVASRSHRHRSSADYNLRTAS